MKASISYAVALCLLLPLAAGAQLRTVHALHSTGPDGFSSGGSPKAIHHYKGYLTVAEDRDAGGSGWDMALLWGDTCRGYMAKSRWYRTSGNTDEGTWAVRMDPTGDAWMVGESYGGGIGGDDAILLRIDTAANLPIVFAKSYGSTGDDSFMSMALTSDGGAILVGATNGFGVVGLDGYICKVDASGTLQWARTIGGSSYEDLRDVIQTSDGGYLIIGTTFSFSSLMSLMLIKLTSTGALTFCRIVNNPSPRWCTGQTLHATPDGGYILCGTEVNGSANPNDADGMMMKLDAAFNVQWTKLYGGIGWDEFWDLNPTDDNGDGLRDDGFIATGVNGTISTTDDYWILKTDASGNLQWSRGWDEGGTDNSLSSIEQLTAQAGYFMVGTDDRYATNGHLLALRTKPDGSGNFSCTMPTISPRVLSATRTLTNIAPTFVARTGSANPTFSSYGFLSAIAVCCCDNWPNNCSPVILDAGDRLALQLMARAGYVDVDWAFESEQVQTYEVWSGAHLGELHLTYSFDAAVHALSDPVADRGLRYYELRALDADGATIASAVKSIVLGGDQAMWLESNRVKSGDPLKWHWVGEEGASQHWEVIDLGGRRLRSGTTHLDASGNAVEWLDTHGWPAGVYVLRGMGHALRVVVD